MVKALDLGVQLLKRGDLYKAKEIFEEILLREENNYVILNLLGITNLNHYIYDRGFKGKRG